jgi:hypothetical protein
VNVTVEPVTAVRELAVTVDLTRFDGHRTSPKLWAEVFDEITEAGQATERFAAA